MVTDANERLKNLIAQMTLKPGRIPSHRYFGYIFSRILRVADENMPSIMGVVPKANGTIALHFKPSLFEGTTDDVLAKVIEHEGMHLLNEHIPRLLRILANEIDEEQKYIKSRIFNVAADCAVNPVIDMPRSPIIAGRPFEGCFPDIYDLEDGQSTEWYYQKLTQQQKDKQKQSGEGKGEGGEGDIGEEYDTIGDHSQWDKIQKEVADVNALSRKIQSQVKEIVKESAKSLNKMRGSLPGYINDLIDNILAPPKVPYYDIIRKLIKGSKYSKFKRSLTRINRKRTYAFVLGEDGMPAISPFPGKTRDFTFKIVILIDTSGSMSPDDIKEALSSCRNILERDRHCQVTILENDTRLQKEYKLKRVSDIDFEVKGRGGTVLKEGIERARELNPDVMLGFTDGYCENINEFPMRSLPKKIIWVVQKDGTIDTLNKTGFIVRVDNG